MCACSTSMETCRKFDIFLSCSQEQWRSIRKNPFIESCLMCALHTQGLIVMFHIAATMKPLRFGNSSLPKEELLSPFHREAYCSSLKEDAQAQGCRYSQRKGAEFFRKSHFGADRNRGLDRIESDQSSLLPRPLKASMCIVRMNPFA